MKHNTSLSNYLLEKRLRSDLSQKELGKKLGFSSGQFISNYEKGRAPVPLIKIKMMIKILNLDANKVIDLMQEERRQHLTRVLLGNKPERRRKSV